MLPGDLLGLLVITGCGVEAETRRVPVFGPSGEVVLDAVLLEDPSLARYLDAVPLRPTAQTLGRFVLARRPLTEALVRHELEHVRQWSRFGPLFLPLYLVDSALALLRGRDPYRANRFELAARAREPGGKSGEGGPQAPFGEPG